MKRLCLHLSALVALAGCAATPDEQGWPPGEALVGARGVMLTQPTLTLTIDQVLPGDETTFTVSSAGANEGVVLVRSTHGTGAGPCLGTLGGLCLDVTLPTVHANATADSSGTATLVQTIPETVPIGADVWFQAVVPRGPSGTLWVTSSAIRITTENAPLTTTAMSPGDLLITEVMADPSAVADGVGEWLEVQNVSGLDANLDGLTISDGLSSVTLGETTFLADGDRIVFGVEDDPAFNGGVDVGREVALSLPDQWGELLLLAGSTLIDGVGWDDGTSFPLDPGRSLVLEDGNDHLSNDAGESWCTGKQVYGAGDLGTPGEANSCETPVLALGDADAVLLGEGPHDNAGHSVSSAGDVNGDGYDDLIVGAPDHDGAGSYAGAAYVVLGPIDTDLDLSLADARLLGPTSSDYAGYSVAGAGDVDNDGYDDLIVGAHYADAGSGVSSGVAYVVLGPITGDLDLDSADARLIGETADDQAGHSVAAAGDVNGDGHDDLLVGAPHADFNGGNSGTVYLVYGPAVGDLDLSAADARLFGEVGNDHAGYAVAGAGDVNGDGYDDILIGAPEADKAYLVLGPVYGDLDLQYADATLLGTPGGSLGTSVASAGDVNGDGFVDLIVGAPDTPGTEVAYVVFGPVAGDVDVADSDAVLQAEETFGNVGSSVAGVGDTNGDGFDDLLVGGSGGADSGVAYLVTGPLSGTHSLTDARLELTGIAAWDDAGASVAGAGDLDGDGLSDFVVGAPNNDAGGTSAGAAYVVLGASLGP